MFLDNLSLVVHGFISFVGVFAYLRAQSLARRWNISPENVTKQHRKLVSSSLNCVSMSRSLDPNNGAVKMKTFKGHSEVVS